MTPIKNLFFNAPRTTLLNTWATLSSASPLRQKTYSVAVCSFRLLATLLLWGTTAHLAGKGVRSLGEFSNLTPLEGMGKAIESAGRRLFLAGGVPLYGVFWALPKKLPNLIYRAARLAERIFTPILLPVWRHVVKPLAKAVLDGIVFLWREVIVPLGRLFSELARIVAENLLSPLWRHLIVPVAEFLSETFRMIITEIGNVARMLVENVLSPLWHRVIVPVAEFLSETLLTLISEVGKAARWLGRHVLLPILKWTVIPLFNALQRVISEIAKGAMWVGRNVFSPLCTHLILPIASAAGAVFVAIQDVAQGVFRFFTPARP